jgi:hypothetical protein
VEEPRPPRKTNPKMSVLIDVLRKFMAALLYPSREQLSKP